MCAFSATGTDAHATCPNRDFTENDNESGFAGKYIQGKKVQINPERHGLKKSGPHQKWQSDFDPHVVVLGLVALVALAVAARGTRLELLRMASVQYHTFTLITQMGLTIDSNKDYSRVAWTSPNTQASSLR